MLTCPITKPIRSAVPTFEPVTLDEAKKQCEVASEVSYHDEHIAGLISAARELVEHDTGLAIATGTYTYKLSAWPCGDYFEIPLRPVTAVSSIVYIDNGGTSTTWASSNYSLETSTVQPIVRLTYGNYFPTLRGDTNGITVTMVAGYAAGSVPYMVKQAVLALIHADWLDHMERTADAAKLRESYERLLWRLDRSTYP